MESSVDLTFSADQFSTGRMLATVRALLWWVRELARSMRCHRDLGEPLSVRMLGCQVRSSGLSLLRCLMEKWASRVRMP